jgi:hypothetical protein
LTRYNAQRLTNKRFKLKHQQFINSSFDTIVATINSVAVVRAVAPLLVLIAGFEFAVSKHSIDFADPHLTSVQFGSIGWGQTHTSLSKPSESPTLEKPGQIQLSKAQRHIASYVSGAYRVGFTEAAHYVSTAYQVAKEHKVDPLLVVAIMSIESSFNPDAQSHAGAQGLMQVLTRVHPEKFRPFGGVGSAFDVYANVYVGTRIIGEYLAREGSLEGALKSYVGAALMSDDSGYGSKVMSQMERFRAISQGKPAPPLVTNKSRSGQSEGLSVPTENAVRTDVPYADDSIRTLLPTVDDAGLSGDAKSIQAVIQSE